MSTSQGVMRILIVDKHAKVMERASALIQSQNDQKSSLMEIFDHFENDDQRVVTHTKLQEALGDNTDLVMKVAGFLAEAGVEVKNDLLTEEDHQALDNWRKLAGIAVGVL